MNELSLLDSLLNGCMDNAVNYDGSCRISPRVDVLESKDSYSLYMDLPGMNEESVDIQIEKGVLKIASVNQKNADKADEKKEKQDKDDAPKYLIRERRNMSFERSFSLPDDVDEENVSASFKNGVLEIQMKKTETRKPRRIEIRAA